jgi:hypothetical protein
VTSPAGAAPATQPRHRLKRPTLAQASAFAALVATVVGVVLKLWPHHHPAPVTKATISDTHVAQPVTFKRFLQRQGLPISAGLTPQYLARRGIMVSFHYEIIGLPKKKLLLRWELSNAATNDLVASEDSAYRLSPSSSDDGGDWAVWVPEPRKGRNYYVTVTIYKPNGPPYELKHFDSPTFRALGP